MGLTGENGTRPWFIGCATDRKFVGPTAAMLSSLDDNGDVPGGIILVADFGLEDEDRASLSDSAGLMGEAMRFVPIDRASPKIVAMPDFDFPLPLLGRLILPGEIDVAGARLLLIDSDIIVNRSLRPLFELDMQGRPLAAAQDPLMAIEYHHHRKKNPIYFNAGVMMLDIDRFNGRGLGEACMRQLASYQRKPIYLDQCAINDVLDGDWLEIDRLWNFFQTAYDSHFERADYEAAHIVHFAGYKPWDVDWHPAGPDWNHHATRAQQKMIAWRKHVNSRPVDRHFVAMQYQVLLGREMEDMARADERAALSRTSATAVVLQSAEFHDRVIGPLSEGRILPNHAALGPPTMAERSWAADALPLLASTAATVGQATNWPALLGALLRDGRLMGTADLPPVVAPDTATAA